MENQLVPTLSQEEYLTVQIWHERISSAGIWDNEDILLLSDAKKATETNLFFSAASTLLVFLERALRVVLVQEQVRSESIVQEDFMNRLEEVERQIEDGRDENNQQYKFNNMCQKVYDLNLIDLGTKDRLIEAYSNIRNAVQHGIYWRLVRNYRDNITIPMIVQEIKEDESDPRKIIEEMFAKNTTNTEASISNPILRCFILPPLMKELTLKLRELIDETTQQVKNNRG